MSSLVCASFTCHCVCEFVHNAASACRLLFLIAPPRLLLKYRKVSILPLTGTGVVSAGQVWGRKLSCLWLEGGVSPLHKDISCWASSFMGRNVIFSLSLWADPGVCISSPESYEAGKPRFTGFNKCPTGKHWLPGCSVLSRQMET